MIKKSTQIKVNSCVLRPSLTKLTSLADLRYPESL